MRICLNQIKKIRWRGDSIWTLLGRSRWHDKIIIILVFEEVKEMMPDQLDTEIQSTQARLEMTTGGGSANTIAEYEQRGRKIEQEREALEGLQNELERLEASIAEIKTRWEPELDALVSKISEAQ